MLARTQFLHRAVCTAPYRRKWGRISQRSYSATGDNEPAWFTQLRSEMLSRDAIYFQEFPTAEHDTKLTRTLSGFLPAEWNSQSSFTGRLLIPGHHLIWFNSTPPTTELLPDGTDTLQSPGDAWVRRMWAGGSVELKPDGYFSKMGGFRVGRNFAGAERIKDVRLRGQGDTEKIFVIIERRFASKATLHASHNKALELSNTRDGADEKAYFLQQLRNDVEWGDAICKEERTLVFFKERTTAELDAIKAGQLAPVKYLERPCKPDFSHALTPTRSLLFRFSALTFNAHLIHLDRDYARNVEGHRNLLVHGPLTLALMLQAIHHYVRLRTGDLEAVCSIKYRNMAPLYCDEEMRICGFKKKTSDPGSAYDVWIEGPTGGVAVRGTVRTFVKDIKPNRVASGLQSPIRPVRKVTSSSQSTSADSQTLPTEMPITNTSRRTSSRMQRHAEFGATDSPNQDKVASEAYSTDPFGRPDLQNKVAHEAYSTDPFGRPDVRKINYFDVKRRGQDLESTARVISRERRTRK